MRTINVNCREKTKSLDDLFGLFFEDINHAADGGLYAELVQNRSFEYDPIDRPEYHALTAWDKSEDLAWSVETKAPLNEENTHYLHVEAPKGSRITNAGFLPGIYVEEGKKYDFSLYVRTDRDLKCRITVEDAESGETCAEEMESLPITQAPDWIYAETVLTASQTTTHGRLVLTFPEDATADLDMISLFPQDTFNGKKKGLRKDIAEALKEMQPKFVRFPGGCLTHDGSLNDHDRNSMYRWKRTIGPVKARPSWRNNWGYNQSLGLGFYEYFCFCEEIGAKPLPVLPGGFNPHKGVGVPMEELQAWVDDATDLIEFAIGDLQTKWGGIRAELGHPAPFDLEYIGIGNEEIGEGFFERYPKFHAALREKYPHIKIINTAGPFAVGEGYETGWASAEQWGSDLVDEHYYSSPEWFLANMHRYEDFTTEGPQVFLGEYASWGNTWFNALVEAAYMTGLEKAPAVKLACYAPMLCNGNYVNWAPDMLWFDNHRIVRTPNYYVQKLFMKYQGTKEVAVECVGFEEAETLGDPHGIPGGISVEQNDTAGDLTKITLTEYDRDGKTVIKIKNMADLSLETNSPEKELETASSDRYDLTFHYQRRAGRKGLKIHFGKGTRNHFLWEFGGWDNWDCNIAEFWGEKAATISHRIFHVEDIPYDLKLEVRGRRIRTFVNGVLWNDAQSHLPEIEDLYVAASRDEGGKTYVKVVNISGEDKETEVVLEGLDGKEDGILITTLSCRELSRENTLDAPEGVVPVESRCTVNVTEMGEAEIRHNFPARSVTVLAIG